MFFSGTIPGKHAFCFLCCKNEFYLLKNSTTIVFISPRLQSSKKYFVNPSVAKEPFTGFCDRKTHHGATNHQSEILTLRWLLRHRHLLPVRIPRLQQLPEILHTSGRDFTEKICAVFKQFFLKFSALPCKTGVQPFGSSDRLYSRFSSCFSWTSCELTFHLPQVSLRQIPGRKVLPRLFLLLFSHPMR